MAFSLNSVLAGANFSRKLSKNTELCTTLTEIITAKRELAIALQNFDFADSDALVDVCAHRILLAQSRYDYVIKKARDNNINYTDYLEG